MPGNPNNKGAGSLVHNFSFEKRVAAADDGYGNEVDAWQQQFTARGDLTFFRGIEKVADAASTGTQKAVIHIRAHTASKLVTTGWRAVDLQTSQSWNIHTVEPMKNRQYIEFAVETGGADG